MAASSNKIVNTPAPDVAQQIELATFLQTNQNEALLALENRQLSMARQFYFMVFGCILLAGCWFAARVYQIKGNYQFLVDWIDGPCKKDGFTLCSGLTIALCLNWRWYNAVFGPNHNLEYAPAVLLCCANRVMNAAIMATGHPGQFLTCLSNVCTVTPPGMKLQKIICAALCGVNSDSCDSDMCLKPCTFSGSAGSPLMGLATGALGGGSSGAGIGFLFHASSAALGSAAGPLAWTSVAVGAGLGMLTSAMTTNRENADLKSKCQTAEVMQSCIPPPGLCS